jgi:cellulose synthase/poly-beta-1,6-N-acetylglucosamine synthase-like glycosyltransferase
MPADQFEIIVVDDGSTDNTADIARQAGVRVVSQPNAGAAAARNLGAHFAGGDLLLFTDADCLPAPDWVAQMCAPFAADPTLAGAKGVYRTRQPELTARFVQMEYQDKYDRMLGTERIDFVDTYSAAYRRDLFLQMGGFDTAFPGASVEDQEFSFRLAEAGYRLIFIPEAKVWHTHDRTVAEYARRKFLIGYWKSLVVQRHPTKLIRDSHTPQVLKLQMGLAALGAGFLGLGLLRRVRPLAAGGSLTWLALCLSGWPFYRKIMAQDPGVLLIAPWLIFIRAWALGLGFLWGHFRLRLVRQLKSKRL